MSHLIYKGKLSTWKDDKGFGFIEPENGTQNVFIHISALKKMSRRPVAGDIISYNLSADKQGKLKAVNAVIEGVKPVSGRRGKRSGYRKSKNSFIGLFFILPIIIFVFLYEKIFENNIFKNITTTTEIGFENTDIPEKNISESESLNYECQGKTRCYEMTSCEEAKFYLRNCPGVKIDGDGDGIPCERGVCSHW